MVHKAGPHLWPITDHSLSSSVSFCAELVSCVLTGRICALGLCVLIECMYCNSCSDGWSRKLKWNHCWGSATTSLWRAWTVLQSCVAPENFADPHPNLPPCHVIAGKINLTNKGSIKVIVLTQRSWHFDGFLYGSTSNWKIKPIDRLLGPRSISLSYPNTN